MARPLLQAALDQTNGESALRAARVLAPEVDVIEAGTILCFADGAGIVERLRHQHPGHIILADLKVADTGAVLAEMMFSRGATWMTVICCAHISTMAAALKVAREHEGDIQIELYGDWTFDQAREWLASGLKQTIYHRSRDAQAAGKSWDQKDIDKIKRLADMGCEVSVTGGLNPEDISFFRGIPVRCFIGGRSLCEGEDPVSVARAFKSAIASEWS